MTLSLALDCPITLFAQLDPRLLGDMLTTGLAGIGIGLVSGLFGVGGGFLIVPILTALYGFQLAWIGTASCQALGQTTTSLLTRRLDWHHLKLPLIVSGGLVTGVWFGAGLLPPGSEAGTNGGGSGQLVLGTYVVLLSLLGAFSLWDVYRTRQGRPLPRGWLVHWRLPPFATFPQLEPSRMSIVVLSWFGLSVGFLAGLVGLSGGMIMLPGLIYCIGMRTHQAVEVTLVIVWLVSAQASFLHAFHNRVDLPLAMALLAGGSIGAHLGTKLSGRIGGPALRNFFGWLLLGTAALAAAQLMILSNH